MDVSTAQPRIFTVDHLPVVRGALEELGILEVIDEFSPLRRGNRVSDSECVGAMVVNILSGRAALYRMESWLATTDVELLLGEGVPARAFTDNRLARALDHIDKVGTDLLMSRVVERYLARGDRPHSYTVHQDTTSIKLWGVYPGGGEPLPTYGFSKDHRPDLKQLVFGLTLHGSVGIPLVHSVSAGNTSDHKANRDHLAQLSRMLPDEDDVTVVADGKLVDADTLGQLLGSGFHFISLVPDSFGVRRKLIEEAWNEAPDIETWEELARQPARRKDLPDKVYRGRSFTRPMAVKLRAHGDRSNPAVPSAEPMRFLVVHSTLLAEKFDKSLANRLEREAGRLRSFAEKVSKRGFTCADDARAAVAEQVSKVKFHHVEVDIAPEVRVLKRPRRGRPRKGEAAPTTTVWTVKFTIKPDDERIEAARRRASCFVLVTDRLDDVPGWSDARVLADYRHQYLIEGHTGFRWLKSEAAVAPMFIKTPSRIRAMGFVFVLALMVRNYIQFTLRRHLRAREETLPHPFTRKQVDNLTTEMAFAHFAAVHSIIVTQDDGRTLRPSPRLNETAQRILSLLGYTTALFTRPPRRRLHSLRN